MFTLPDYTAKYLTGTYAAMSDRAECVIAGIGHASVEDLKYYPGVFIQRFRANSAMDRKP